MHFSIWLFDFSDHTRIARLLKSPSQQHRIAHFQITPDGIR
jgi:hypothetical protein